jgi:hypothetical protein
MKESCLQHAGPMFGMVLEKAGLLEEGACILEISQALLHKGKMNFKGMLRSAGHVFRLPLLLQVHPLHASCKGVNSGQILLQGYA